MTVDLQHDGLVAIVTLDRPERRNAVDHATLLELLADLDRRYPGLKFRVVDEQGQMRAHMRFFVNNEQVFDLSHALRPTDEVYLLQALSGG